MERLERIAHAKARYEAEQQRIREEQEEEERQRREEKESRERDVNGLWKRNYEDKMKQKKKNVRRLEEEREAATAAESAAQREKQSVYRPPSARASTGDADSEWKSVRSNRTISEAPEGNVWSARVVHLVIVMQVALYDAL